MNSCLVLLLATREEAASLVALLGAEGLREDPFCTYRFAPAGPRPGGFVLISGMGPANAAAATRHAITVLGANRIVNLGICGALSAGLAPGQLLRITEAADGDAAGDARQALPFTGAPPGAAWVPARLVSVAEPVFDPVRRARLAEHGDVVDMEGFAVARTSRQLGIPCDLLKGVSDRADTGGRRDLLRNLDGVSEALARQAVAELAHRPRLGGRLPVRLAAFVKVEHTLFSVPLLLAGAWLGSGRRWPGWRPLLLIVLAGLGARALGMAMNRILDRRLDALNPRTAGRELPSGRLTAVQAWSVAAAGFIVYLFACAALGPVCLRLAPIPALVLVFYSLLKRFTSLCHFGIGAGLALGPLGAFVAVTGGTNADGPILLLALFTFCWISGFDILYALQDLAADRDHGVHSLPAALGSRGAQGMAALTHALALAAAAELWRLSGGGLTSGLALAVAALAFALAYVPQVPLPVRFFPLSAVAGIAGAAIPLLGGDP
jgi:4-hydroxybenzoate polyprenyltransferase